MNVKTCLFVEGTEVFKDCPNALVVFFESNPDCSWGDNNRTLVSPDVIIDSIESIVDLSEPDNDEKSLDSQVRTVFERLDGLPENVYVDLEN